MLLARSAETLSARAPSLMRRGQDRSSFRVRSPSSRWPCQRRLLWLASFYPLPRSRPGTGPADPPCRLDHIAFTATGLADMRALRPSWISMPREHGAQSRTPRGRHRRSVGRDVRSQQSGNRSALVTSPSAAQADRDHARCRSVRRGSVDAAASAAYASPLT